MDVRKVDFHIPIKAIRASRRILGPLFLVISIAFMLVAIWKSITSTNVNWLLLDYRLIGIVFLGLIFSVWLGVVNWIIFASLFGFPRNTYWHARTHILSNIAKYMPGAVWGFLSKGVLAEKIEQSRRTIASAISLEFILAILSGISLILFSGGWQKYGVLPSSYSFVISFGGGVLVLLSAYMISSVAINRRKANLFSRWPVLTLRESGLFLILIINLLLGWTIQSIGFQHLVGLFSGANNVPTQYWIFSYTASVVLGILILFVPNGVGVREAVIVSLLGDSVQFPYLIFGAVIIRILIIFAELTSFLLIIAIEAYLKKNNRLGLL